MGILFFFFNDTATTEIYTLSLHDALPISEAPVPGAARHGHRQARQLRRGQEGADALGRAPPAQGPEQPGGELAPADATTRTADEALQVGAAGPALPLRDRKSVV